MLLKYSTLSMAGYQTSVVLPELKVAFDMGGLPARALSAQHIFITHCHLDHIAAIPQHASRRIMRGQTKPATYFLPNKEAVVIMQGIIKNYVALSQAPMPCNFKVLEPNEKYSLHHGRYVTTFPTKHRVASQGYIIWQNIKTLKPEFIGKTQKELAILNKQGCKIHDESVIPEVAYTGDTTIEGLENCLAAQQAKTLFIETTYVDEANPPEKAKRRGHIHLLDIAAMAPRLTNERIVLIHFSARYTAVQI
eukprot:Ihof_evm8s9 gene=Ihof_evmTU8s9